MESPSAARSYTYSLFVDGAPMLLTDVRCADFRSAGGVECSGRLPTLPRGTHMLELSASLSGFESGRSQPLAVSVSSLAGLADGTAPILPSSSPSSDTSGAAVPALCFEVASRECYDRRLLGRLAGPVTALATAGDLIFVVEGNSQIRVVANDVLQEEPALTLEAGARITGIAIPPDFESTRVVFVAWTEPSSSGDATLNITRYRELLGTLGEAATIVTGLSVATGHGVPITVDDQGLIYVALPESGSNTSSNGAAWSNSILRFDADGHVPPVNPTSSPVIAHGYAMPAALVWNSGARELWLSGSDPRWSAPVSVLRVDVDRRASWPSVPSPVNVAASESQFTLAAPLLAVSRPSVSTTAPRIWVVQENSVAQRITRSSGRGVLRVEGVPLDRFGQVVAISEGPGRDLLLAAQTATREFVFWRLTPRDPVP